MPRAARDRRPWSSSRSRAHTSRRRPGTRWTGSRRCWPVSPAPPTAGPYREELARGRSGPDALREAIEQVGGALVASAGTVIVGLGMLWFSSFAKIQYTGPAIALSLAIGLLAALTLAPVLLHWLRGAVFFPFRPPHHEKGADPDLES